MDFLTTNLSVGGVHGARYLTNFRFIDLEATVGTYEIRSYGGDQGVPWSVKNYLIFDVFLVDIQLDAPL